MTGRPLRSSALTGLGFTGAALATLIASLATVVLPVPVPSTAAAAEIPAGYLRLYQRFAAACPGLDWTLLAGVGTVETANGQSPAPGVHSGVNQAGAAGPMQFEPATFAEYDRPIPPGGANPPSPYDPVDAIAAAARYLCALGVTRDPRGALVAYNCGNTGPACQLAAAPYAAEVLADATSYTAITTSAGPSGPAASPAARVALTAALSVVGTPYRWGGEAPGGFDCSGLVQWAYARAGLVLPRNAQAQYRASTPLPAGAAPAPGDLLFYGHTRTEITHVGIYLGAGEMLDAPHAGASVRVEPDQWPDLVAVTNPFTPRAGHP
ncbi:MAG: C40 family peptidase [Mycobacteriales bacterium]